MEERIEVYESPGLIARVHTPELTEDERTRRMAQIKKASTRLLIAKEKSK